jgi:hypothetical protein
MKVILLLEGKKDFSLLVRKDRKGCDNPLWTKSDQSNPGIATREEMIKTGAGKAHKRRMGNRAPEAQGGYPTSQQVNFSSFQK